MRRLPSSFADVLRAPTLLFVLQANRQTAMFTITTIVIGNKTSLRMRAGTGHTPAVNCPLRKLAKSPGR
jgi:hypothetical protein